MADNRLAYGLAKKHGIDTEGMTPKQVWEALKKAGIDGIQRGSGAKSGSIRPGEGERAPWEEETVRLPDIQIGRSLGAKALNYKVMDLQTGECFSFVEGTKLQDVEVFCGKGTKKIYRNAYKYAIKHGGKEQEWQHVKAVGVLDTPEGHRRANVHWSQHDKYGKHDFFIKEWLD